MISKRKNVSVAADATADTVTKPRDAYAKQEAVEIRREMDYLSAILLLVGDLSPGQYNHN